jgi:hypothetical protein
MEHKSENRTAPSDGTDGLALVIVPVILAAMMLVTAAAFAGGEVESPAATAVQAGALIDQN